MHKSYEDDLSEYNLYEDDLREYNLYVDDLSEYNLCDDSRSCVIRTCLLLREPESLVSVFVIAARISFPRCI